MTVGEKITYFRGQRGLSQEKLAELLDVSRQSVSKWETNLSVPQTEKILPLCSLLGISADFLLNDKASPIREDSKKNETGKNRYFGTDGFRGEVNRSLTTMHAYMVGRFLGWYYQNPLSGQNRAGYRPRIVIGKDTRRPSCTIEYALVAGTTASGGDACMLHVITTPGVAFVTRQDEFDCGIMITASHNPFYDNGIKVLNGNGEKMDDKTISYIESYLDGDLGALGIAEKDLPYATRDRLGCITDYISGRNRYVGYLISVASHSYRRLRIGLDTANGSSWMIAKAVFDALGANTVLIGAQPDGLNVNRDCGSTHIEALRQLVREKKLDVGFAFDGDADRCLAVDENGEIVDGDKILYILGKRLKERGNLDGDTVVATVMSNQGLLNALKKEGIRVMQTKVGDRFVYEAMEQYGYRLGGEQSGHIILRKYATTGDGLLTAIMLTEEMLDRKAALSELAAPVVLLPQKLKNVRVTSKAAAIADKGVQEALRKAEKALGEEGRILLRESGTEPVVRIMVECTDDALCDRLIASVYDAIQAGGYVCGD